MIRPERMTLLSIQINEKYLPTLMNDILLLEEFHVKKSARTSGGEEKTETDEIFKTGYYLSSDQIRSFQEKINYINGSIDKLYSYYYMLENKEPPEPKKYDKKTIEFESIEELLDNLSSQVEDDCYRYERLIKQLENTDKSLKNMAELLAIVNIIRKYGGAEITQAHFNYLKFDMYTCDGESYTSILLALKDLKKPVICHGEEIAENLIAFFLFYTNDLSEKVEEICNAHNCRPIDIPDEFITENRIDIDKIVEEHDNLIKRRENLIKRLEEFSGNIPFKIKVYEEALENAAMLINTMKEVKRSLMRNYVIIEGYIQKRHKKDIIKALTDQFGNKIKITAEDVPDRDMYEEEDKGVPKEHAKYIDVPSYVKESRIFGPIELIIGLYGRPHYSEIYPAFIMLLSFPLLFGLMFGDIGHGGILILSGIIGYIMNRKKSAGAVRFSFLLVYCGLGAVFGGLMYGDFFGYEFMINGKLFRFFVNPFEEVIPVLKMSIVIGVVMLSLGFIFRIINYWRVGKKFLAFADPFTKLLILLGGTRLIFTYYFDIQAWLKPPYPIMWVIAPTLLLLVAMPIGRMMGVSYLKEKSFGALMGEHTLDVGETMLQMVSNTASFMRILALEMAHIGLMLVMRIVADMINFPFVSILILIAGNAFVILLELIIVMIHDLRLHFYEFFSKFFSGIGRPYEPVALSSNYCLMHFKEPSNVPKFLDIIRRMSSLR